MFQIKKAQQSNKTIRMPDSLIDRLQRLADQNDISFNQLVVQCCEYAINDMADQTESPTKEQKNAVPAQTAPRF